MAACVALVGCGEAPSGPIVEFNPCQPLALVADPSATPAQTAGIAAAIALWNGLAGTQLSLAAAPTGPAVPIHFQTAAGNFHGLYDGVAAQIFINVDLTDHAETVVITHEVGHVMGLVHIPPAERPSVMNPGNLTIEPTAADIGALATRWGSCG